MRGLQARPLDADPLANPNPNQGVPDGSSKTSLVAGMFKSHSHGRTPLGDWFEREHGPRHRVEGEEALQGRWRASTRQIILK